MNTMKPHTHRAVPERQTEQYYSHPVRQPENPAAHGGVCFVDRCRCGATRRTNVNGWHRERGPWCEPQR